LNTDGVPDNEQNVSALEGIDMSLHGCLLPKANIKNTKMHSAYANEQSILDLEQLDDLQLCTFILVVATGNKFEKPKEDTSRRAIDQREYNATYAATDLIRTSKDGARRGSNLKSMISDMLMCSNTSDTVISFLNYLGLSYSGKHLAETSSKAVDKTLKSGWNQTVEATVLFKLLMTMLGLESE
jgi:hypothetical protein